MRFSVLLVGIILGMLWLFKGEIHAQTRHQQTIDSLLTLLARSKPDTNRVNILYGLAYETNKTDIDLSLEYSKESLKLSDSLGYKMGMADAYNILGMNYLDKLDYRNALFYFLKAVRLLENMEGNKGLGYPLNNIGVIYMDLNRLDLAQQYFMRSIENFGNRMDKAGIAYSNLGSIASKRGLLDSAVIYYKRALELTEASKNKNNRFTIFCNLGETYFDLNEYDTAKMYLINVLQEKALIAPQRLAFCYYVLGEIALKESDYIKAKEYLNASLDLLLKVGAEEKQQDAYELLAEVHAHLKQFDLAYQYRLKADALKDSSMNKETVAQIANLQKAYEVERRDNTIQLLNKDKEIQYAKARNTRNLLITGFVFLLVVVGFVTRNIILKQRIKNKALSEERIQLLHDNTIARYEVLKSKTNPHFLFNSLTTLASLVIADKQKALSYIHRFSELYRMILKTGEQQVIGLDSEMKVVEHYLFLQQMRFREDLVVNIEMTEEMDKWCVPPFSVQMVVENAIKHNMIAEDAKLIVEIKVKGDNVYISNNLQPKFSKIASTNLGQKNIMERYKMLTDREPEYLQSAGRYTVKLPLLQATTEKSVLIV